MKPKLLFFDIDGTLLTEDTLIIPESTKRALKEAQRNGHITFINTGRPFVSVDKFIKDLNFDGYICGCGTFVMYKDKVLLYNKLDTKECKKLVKKLREYNIDGILEGHTELYYDTDENINSDYVKSIKKRHIETNLYKGKTFDEEDIQFDKLTIFGDENSNFDDLKKDFEDVFEFIYRGEYFYELVPHAFSKASGIKFLEDTLKIPHENTYAFGDSSNDLSMLEYAANSVAMGSGNKDLFDKVSFVTKDINEDGIEYALKHYNII
ncbi:MAG: HAD family hydrolase [Clostridium sp.]|uniref:HAD family hydrolase n=1 Tax=Clostridium sp. DSM 8431 TaxID=1761781 RepID=UPI0008E8BB62|nr:HAD family hydrolase [Clostridium sp. DSM 8431]MCR4942994.1 HAD family hydrolase [Clostridium sp.]SFU46503.1 hypothetical protein SAMN04487886_103410 [Clostridium sp. DSM 8431]